MSKERLPSFEDVVRFCSLACHVMVYFLKTNSLTQDELRNLPLNRKLGVSIRELLLNCIL